MEDYKFSEINETEEAKNASLSVSLQPTFSNTSQNITVDLQELKEESLEMSIQQKKLKEKYEEAKQIAFNKHFEVTQLIHQIFGTHVANIELLYESKESILGRRKQFLNQTYKRVSRANTPLFCGNGRLELTFDASSMSLHDNTINEHAIFDGNNDDYDADSIENFEFSKLKKMGKLVKQLHSIANDLKFDNALIKLKNKENKEWQKQNGITGNDDDDDDDDSNNNNKNNNKKNSGNDNSSSASEDDDEEEDDDDGDTVLVAYEYQAPDGNQATQSNESNESNESNDSNKSNKSSKSNKSNKLAAKSNKSKKSSKSQKNNKGSKSNKGHKPNKSAKASKTPQVHTAKKSHDKTKGGAHVLKRQVSKRRNTLSGLNGMKGLKRRSVRNVTNGKKDKNEKNGKNGKNETRHLKLKTINIPNLETFAEMIDTVNEDNSDVSNGGSKNGGGIVTTAPNVKNVREIWEEKTRQTAKSKQRHRSQSSIRHVKTRSLSPGLQPVQMYD